MPFQVNTEIEIPTEDKTIKKILAIAAALGGTCLLDAKKVFRKYQIFVTSNNYHQEAKEKAAEDLLVELSKIDVRLIGWLMNETGEIVVGNRVVLKFVQADNIFNH